MMRTKLTVKLALALAVAISSGYSLGENAPTLHLETNVVADREQPKVSYFIPWKSTGGLDELHWKLDPRNDETLRVIDRNVLLRASGLYNSLDMESRAEN